MTEGVHTDLYCVCVFGNFDVIHPAGRGLAALLQDFFAGFLEFYYNNKTAQLTVILAPQSNKRVK